MMTDDVFCLQIPWEGLVKLVTSLAGSIATFAIALDEQGDGSATCCSIHVCSTGSTTVLSDLLLL
jgi:hypothetical protein